MSLEIANARVRAAVLSGVPKSGPPSLQSRWARARYRSPAGLNEAFQEAQKLLAQEKDNNLKKAQELKSQLKDTLETQQHQKIAKELEKTLARAEFHNPEVKYNHMIKAANRDMSEPVYRMLQRTEWSRRELLVLMQRLEQHHVIPDTLPTIVPRAQVKLRFETPQATYLEPGVFVTNSVCARAPYIEVQEFDKIDENSLYSVLIVNPDEPDVANDSFKTRLHFAVSNLKLSNNRTFLDYRNGTTLAQYEPPHPEKNGPVQRFCVFVFSQNGNVVNKPNRERFDIRRFVADNELHPVGAHLWRVRYDLTTQGVREKHNLGPGRVFYRARTEHPEEALLHVRHRKQWSSKVRS